MCGDKLEIFQFVNGDSLYMLLSLNS